MNQTISKRIGTVNGIQIQMHLERIYDELIYETYGKNVRWGI